MKKVISIVLTAAMLLSLTACGNSQSTAGNNSINTQNTTDTSSESIDVSDWVGIYECTENKDIGLTISQDVCEVRIDGEATSVTPYSIHNLGENTELQLRDDNNNTYHLVCFSKNTSDNKFDFGVTDSNKNQIVENVFMKSDSRIGLDNNSSTESPLSDNTEKPTTDDKTGLTLKNFVGNYTADDGNSFTLTDAYQIDEIIIKSAVYPENTMADMSEVFLESSLNSSNNVQLITAYGCKLDVYFKDDGSILMAVVGPNNEYYEGRFYKAK